MRTRHVSRSVPNLFGISASVLVARKGANVHKQLVAHNLDNDVAGERHADDIVDKDDLGQPRRAQLRVATHVSAACCASARRTGVLAPELRSPLARRYSRVVTMK